MAWIGALISAGVGLYQSRQAEKQANKATQLTPFERQMQHEQLQNQRALRPIAVQNMNKGNAALNTSEDFWRSLMSGNRTSILEQLAPQMAEAGQANQAATRAASELTPRGGLQASQRGAMPFAQAAGLGNAIMSMKQSAGEGLQAVGAGRLGMGMTGLGQVNGGQSALANLAAGERWNRYNATMNAGRDAAMSAYQMYNMMNGAFSGMGQKSSLPAQTNTVQSAWAQAPGVQPAAAPAPQPAPFSMYGHTQRGSGGAWGGFGGNNSWSNNPFMDPKRNGTQDWWRG